MLYWAWGPRDVNVKTKRLLIIEVLQLGEKCQAFDLALNEAIRQSWISWAVHVKVHRVCKVSKEDSQTSLCIRQVKVNVYNTKLSTLNELKAAVERECK